jgi:hypothetical protein
LAEQSRIGYLAQVSIFYVHIMYGVILFAALMLNAAVDCARRGRMAAETE